MCVDGEIHQHLFNHAAVAVDGGKFFGRVEFQHNGFAQQPAQHLVHVADDFPQINHAGLHHVFAGEHEQLQRPAQIVVAYSEANFGLASQPFFQLADAVLQKSADYIDFKAKVDELLEARFSLGFYIDRIAEETHLGEKDRAKLSQLATQAIVEGKRSNLVSFLRDHSDAATLERVLRIVEVAISVASLWTK